MIPVEAPVTEFTPVASAIGGALIDGG
jgi:hypothetical protein